MKLALDAQSRKVALFALAGVLLLVTAVNYVWSKHRWAQSRLAELEPRYARLKGIESSGPALDGALTERRAALTRRAYDASTEASQAGSDAQQRIRDVFTKSGLQVSSLQVLPSKPVNGVDRIPVVIRADGDLPALQSALAVLPSQSPLLFVESMSLQTAGVGRPELAGKLSVQITLFALRAAP